MKKKRAKSILAFQWQLQSEMIILNATATVAGACYPDLFPGAWSKQTAHSLLFVLALRRSVTCRAIYRLTSAKPLTARNNAHIFILVSEQSAKLTCEIPGCKTVLEGRPISLLKTVQHLRGYGKQVGCMTQANLLMTWGKTTSSLKQGSENQATVFFYPKLFQAIMSWIFEWSIWSQESPLSAPLQFVCLSDFSGIEAFCKLVLTADKFLQAAGLHVHFAAQPARALQPTLPALHSWWAPWPCAVCPSLEMLRSAPNWAQCCAHGVQSECETQKGQMEVWGRDRRKHITFNHINGRRFWKLLQMFTPADKMLCRLCQILKVPERDNTAGSECNHNKASSIQEEDHGELAASKGGREIPALELWVIFYTKWEVISLGMELKAYDMDYPGWNTLQYNSFYDDKPYSLV